jgi:hypothetical protein
MKSSSRVTVESTKYLDTQRKKAVHSYAREKKVVGGCVEEGRRGG